MKNDIRDYIGKEVIIVNNPRVVSLNHVSTAYNYAQMYKSHQAIIESVNLYQKKFFVHVYSTGKKIPLFWGQFIIEKEVNKESS